MDFFPLYDRINEVIILSSPFMFAMIWKDITSSFKSFGHLLLPASSLYQFLLFHANPFWIQLSYFVTSSAAGFLLLRILPMRDPATTRPADVDLLFMSVSAVTVSSMDTVEMEDFSVLQLAALTLLMAFGGEVFVSLLGLFFAKARFQKRDGGIDDLELDNTSSSAAQEDDDDDNDDLGFRSMKRLIYLVLGFLLVTHVAGALLILLYLVVVPAAGGVLERKGLSAPMFSIFTAVSTLANCGFVPTNENMVVFRTFSGLLLILAAQALVGNTMYASTLRALVWALKKATGRPEYDYLLNGGDEVGYDHLVPGRQAASLALTVVALVAVQLAAFCGMEWSSGILSGLTPYQKIFAAVFMSVNSRYAGETVVDLSAVAPAMLVLWVVMMYLPPYTCFLPGEKKLENDEKRKQTDLIFSPLGYIAVFTIIICVTERRQISEDPLNFSVLNILVEVVSAYGTVGFTTGYSCKRRLKAEALCRDAMTGFAGRWSKAGKLVLIVVMLLGRLRRFSLRGGRYWLFI